MTGGYTNSDMRQPYPDPGRGVRATAWRASERQQDAEPGVTQAGLDADVAVVLVDHDAVRDVQAQPGPLADRLGREERLGRPRPPRRRDPRARVRRPPPDPCARAGRGD